MRVLAAQLLLPDPREVRAAQVQRLDDPAVDVLGDRAVGDRLDDQARDEVVRVAVRERARAGALLLEREVQQRARLGVPVLVRQESVGEEVRVVREAARVVEQHPDGDLIAGGDLAGQIALDGRVELELALLDELEHDDRGERLRVAADAHLAVDRDGGAALELTDAGREVADAALVVADGGERGGIAVLLDE